MPEPDRDGGERLERIDRLYRALARSRATTQAIEEAIAEEEGSPTEELYQHRRRSMRALLWIPILIGGLGEVIHWAIGHRKTVALVSAGSALATVLAIHPWTDQSRRPHATPKATRPAPTQHPSRTRPTPRPPATAPPTSRPPAWPGGSPSPTATRTSTLPPMAAEPPSPIGIPSPAPSTSTACLIDLERPIPLKLLCQGVQG